MRALLDAFFVVVFVTAWLVMWAVRTFGLDPFQATVLGALWGYGLGFLNYKLDQRQGDR